MSYEIKLVNGEGYQLDGRMFSDHMWLFFYNSGEEIARFQIRDVMYVLKKEETEEPI